MSDKGSKRKLSSGQPLRTASLPLRARMACVAVLTGIAVSLGSAMPGWAAGKVVVYGYPGGYIEALAAAFKKKHPDIEVSLITGDGPEVLGRLMGERERPRADVIDATADVLLTHTDLFQPFRSQYHNDFPEWGIIKKGDDVLGYGYTILMQVFMVNTRQMDIKDAPKSWKDIVKPQYKGKIMFGNPALVEAGLQTFKQLRIMYGDEAARQLVQNAKFGDSASFIPPAVGRGEVPIGIVEETRVMALKKDGYPVEIIYPEEGVVPTITGTALVKNGPNPENAKLFAEFIISPEGHAINLKTRNRRSPRVNAPTPQGLVPMSELKINTAISAEEMIADRKATLDFFNKLFLEK